METSSFSSLSVLLGSVIEMSGLDFLRLGVSGAAAAEEDRGDCEIWYYSDIFPRSAYGCALNIQGLACLESKI